jgi:hypothetical protein
VWFWSSIFTTAFDQNLGSLCTAAAAAAAAAAAVVVVVVVVVKREGEKRNFIHFLERICENE